MTRANKTVEEGVVRLRPLTCRCHIAKVHSDMPSREDQLSVFLASMPVCIELEFDFLDPVSRLKEI